MNIKNFQDADILCIELRPAKATETKDLDENTLIELDSQDHVCGITIEHAQERAEIPKFSFEKIPAQPASAAD